MKRVLLILLMCVMGVAAPAANATVYSDTAGDEAFPNAHLDIVSVEVTNDSTDLMLKINLTGDPITTDWGKYLVAIDSVAAGDTAGNGWGRPISMPSGMDYFIGSWVDWGDGAELYSWDGAVWNLDHATGSPPSDIQSPAKTTDSVTLTTTLSSLGLSNGDSFIFDVFTSGGGGGDSAIDALSDPAVTVGDWGDPYTSTSALSYTVVVNKAFAPNPANDAIEPTGTVSALSWTNPPPSNGTDPLAISVKLDIEPGVGIYDPNDNNVSTGGGTDIETIAISALTPAKTSPLPDGYYSWQVTVTDPNTGGTPTVTAGPVWLFEVGDAPPVVSQPVDQYMYISQTDGDGDSNIRTFTVDFSYTDDGKTPITVADVNNLNWGWDPDGPDDILGNADDERGVELINTVYSPTLPATTTSGTVTATFETKYNAADPNFSTDLPGIWNIRLEVTDGTGTVLGATGYHRITESCGQAAAEDPTDNYDEYFDTNGDCIVNLVDFSDFATAWLNQGVKYE